MMPVKWEVVKNQRFDVTRVINVLKCSECKNKCDYMRCDNYCRKTTIKKYKNPDEFWKAWKENNSQLAKEPFKYSDDDEENNLGKLFEDVIDFGITFPKGIYWCPKYFTHNGISLLRKATRVERSYLGNDFVEFGDVFYENGRIIAFCNCYAPERVIKLKDRIENYMKRILELWKEARRAANGI